VSEIDLSQLAGPAATLAVELIMDIVNAVATAREHDHDALLARLAEARIALAGARGEALAARAEGAALLRAGLATEEPK
jgi:hypothetical protein